MGLHALGVQESEAQSYAHLSAPAVLVPVLHLAHHVFHLAPSQWVVSQPLLQDLGDHMAAELML